MEIKKIKDQVPKTFDIVTDPSDHHFLKKSSKKHTPYLLHEWDILQKNLPADSTLVRVYKKKKSRFDKKKIVRPTDLMRVVVLGSSDTPYCHGLFFFDVWFPPDYPRNPPKVYYHSHGLDLNPNLQSDGIVRLKDLNTLKGQQKDLWLANKSMLDVLKAIATSVLNAKPYFNQPDLEHERATPSGESNAVKYNNHVFRLSCQNMLRTLEKPPKHFDDFVRGHFRRNANSILHKCKEYMAGGADIAEEVKLLLNAFEANGTSCKHLAYLVNREKGIVTYEEKGTDEISEKDARTEANKHGALVKSWMKMKNKMGMKKSTKVVSTF